MNRNGRSRRGRSALNELVIISCLAVLVFAAAIRFEVFERFSAWNKTHDAWRVDDIAVVFIVLGLAAGVFAWRRWRELSAEVVRRRRAEDSLRRSESSYRQIVEQAQDIIYMTDASGRFTFCNPSASRLLKYTAGEITGRHYLELIRPADRAEVERFYREQVNSLTPATYKEFVAVAKDGAELLIGQNVQFQTDGGRVAGFQAVARDITEQRHAEDALRRMEEYRNLFRLANDAILILDASDGRVLDVNEKACETYCIAREEFVGRSLMDITQDGEGARLRLERLRTEGRLEEFETRHTRADGAAIHFLINTSLVEYQGRRAILSVNRDVTERKRAEQAQAALQLERDQLIEQLQLQIEVMPLAFILSDETNRTTYWNPAAERIFGFTKTEMIGTCGHKLLVPPESQPFVEAIFERIAGGEVMSSTFTDNVTRDGQRITCEWYSAPLRKADGTFIGIMSMAQDISERRQAELARGKLEAQLRQSQKMEAVGTLAGGIAHDFNNILAAIIGNCEMALLDLNGDEATQARLDKVLRASGRAKELVRQILTFSRQEEHEHKPLRLQPIIEETLKLLRSSLPSSIEIRQDVDPAAPSILGDPTQVHQVIMNLGTNAGHAMGERGGVLEVGLSAVEVDEQFAESHPGLRKGPHLRFVVSDSGTGMNRATRERIFEPFFTTKEQGKGTGLGLSVVHGIVKKLGGAITVYSEPGRGTTFNLYLPAHGGEARAEAQKKEAVPEGGGERILLVDDEEELASLGASMLGRLGYRVTSEVSSVEALKTFSSRPDDFDLVITDQTMPGMSGFDLARVLLGIRPGLPVILATGYSTSVNPERAQALGIREFLLKPHTAQSLGEAVRRALEAGRKVTNDVQSSSY